VTGRIRNCCALWVFSNLNDRSGNWCELSESNVQIALKVYISYDSATLFLEIYSKELIIDAHKLFLCCITYRQIIDENVDVQL
jgi:hypothetical protein